jgi:hypothetical protein
MADAFCCGSSSGMFCVALRYDDAPVSHFDTRLWMDELKRPSWATYESLGCIDGIVEVGVFACPLSYCFVVVFIFFHVTLFSRRSVPTCSLVIRNCAHADF